MKQRMFDEYEVRYTCRVAIGKTDRNLFREKFMQAVIDSVMEGMCAESGCGFTITGDTLEIELLEELA